MSAPPRLFCLDHVLIDVVLKINALPVRAGDTLASEQLVTTGGGFNAMSAAARHGMRVAYAGRLGVGPFSSLAIAALDGDHIAAPVDRNEDVDTGLCVVLLEPDGERTFVTSPGAEATLRARDLETLGVRGGDYVLVSGYNVMYPRVADIVINWLTHVPEEIIVVFDPATRMTDIPEANLGAMLERANWLLCNATEASLLSGSDDAVTSAVALSSKYDALNVVVRNGSKGCVVVPRKEVARTVDGFVTTVVDTNGAGDVHNGVFLAELASGHEVAAAARWANAAAAMSISRLGPASCPPREEVAEWIAASSS